MLDINEKDLKLLKMKEKMLEVNSGNLEDNLREYKKLATTIDKGYYDSIINRINESNYHSQTLEEELVFLEELEKEYQQLYELQCRFKNMYEQYSDEKLELSDIGSINIEGIRERISIISGYLINLKNIKDSKIALGELNEELISEEKIRKNISDRIVSLENALEQSFLNAEGRIFSIGTGSNLYTSVVSEYSKNDIDVKELLSNKENLVIKLKEATNDRTEKEDVLEAAQICYDSMPNKENKEILDSISVEAIKARYKLALLKMLELISRREDEYKIAKNKREDLKDLIKYRKKYLDDLGIKFSIDPFDRIRIDDQLEYINNIDDNSKKINAIKRKMTNISSRLEEMGINNDELIEKLGYEYKLIIDNLSMSSINIDDVTESDVQYSFDNEEFDDIKVEVQENQVVSMKDLSQEFRLSRAREKANGVIKRVSEMVIEPTLEETTDNVDDKVVPELLLVDVPNYHDEVDLFKQEDMVIFDEQPIVEEIKKDDLEEINVLDKVDSFEQEDLVQFEQNPMFEERNENILEDINTLDFVSDNEEDLIGTERNEDIFSDSDSVFQSIVPFEEVKMFSDKLDDIEPTEEVAEDIMPDAFWVTQDSQELSNNIDDSEIISFDDQIDMLLSDSNNSKVKRKVA